MLSHVASLVLALLVLNVTADDSTTAATTTSCQSISGSLSTLTSHILSLKNNSDQIERLDALVERLKKNDYDTNNRIARLEQRLKECGCSGGVTSPETSGIAPTVTVDPTVNADYSEALGMSILFYEAQRSGRLPSNNRIPWRGDSALGDKGYNGEDLTGGWYDAGDNVKFGFPMASSTTLLLWGVLKYKRSYERTGTHEDVLDSLRWPLEYFLKCHVAPNQFYAQVGDSVLDHAYWGRPEEMTMARPSFMLNETHPGTEVAAETAAAMAVGSMVFKESDPTFSDTLLEHAKQLYKFADEFRRKYTDSITEAVAGYNSYSGYEDELAWGALWLHKATGDRNYLIKATQHVDSGLPYSLSWDLKTPGNQLLYFEATADNTYKSSVEKYLTARFPGGSIPTTPRGLTYRAQWSTMQYAGNDAFLALMAADLGILVAQGSAYAASQIDYILGKTTGVGYVVGFGSNPPLFAHHAAASCPSPPATCDWSNFHSKDPNPHVIKGAVVGGPDTNDNRVDKRDQYKHSEVACTLNAGYQSALAGLIELS